MALCTCWFSLELANSHFVGQSSHLIWPVLILLAKMTTNPAQRHARLVSNLSGLNRFNGTALTCWGSYSLPADGGGEQQKCSSEVEDCLDA
jgi:hypothetical protein